MGLMSRRVLRADSHPRAGTRPGTPCREIAGQIDEVADHGAGRGHHPGALPVEQDGSHRVPGEVDRVHGAADVGQHVVPGHQGGMDPGLHPVPVIPGNGQEFQAVTEFPGELQVQGVKPADALHGDGFQVELGPVGQAHENGQFVGGVDAFHVQGGIGFGVAVGLGLGQGVGIGGAALGHPGEDVIGGAV